MRYFSDAYQRTGTLWKGRYKATLIDSEAYLLTCYRYIELNPVQAGMVARPRGYPWSSYRCHADGEADALVTDHALYQALGVTTETRQAAYRELFNSHLHEVDMVAIREATNKALALGSEHFKKEIAAMATRRVQPPP